MPIVEFGDMFSKMFIVARNFKFFFQVLSISNNKVGTKCC